MSWRVLAAPGVGDDAVAAVLAAVGERSPASLDHDLAASHHDGIVVVGTDADLAIVARRLGDAGDQRPVALVPSGRSDLLRMFGLDASAVLRRLGAGEPYPTDLGIVSSGTTATPFVGHVHARGARRAAMTVRIADRAHRVRGWQVIAANAQHLGDRQVAPRAAVMDGRLDLQVVAGSRRRWSRLARRGLQEGAVEIWRRRPAEAEVVVPDRWAIRADGRTVGHGRFGVRVVEGAFRLWI